jgi:hypothetical protein
MVTKTLIIIMVLSLLCSGICSMNHNYQVQNGVNINSNVDANWIISSMRKESYIFCLAICNSNQECLTSVFMESVAIDNCILYKKHFDLTETTTSSNTRLFIKKSKYRFEKQFFKDFFFFQNSIIIRC